MEYPSSEYGGLCAVCSGDRIDWNDFLAHRWDFCCFQTAKNRDSIWRHHPTGTPDCLLVHGNSVSERRFVQAKRTLCDFSTGKADSAKSCESLEQFLWGISALWPGRTVYAGKRHLYPRLHIEDRSISSKKRVYSGIRRKGYAGLQTSCSAGGTVARYPALGRLQRHRH